MNNINCYRIGCLSKVYLQHTRCLTSIKNVDLCRNRCNVPTITKTRNYVSVYNRNEGTLRKIMKKIPFLDVNKNRLRALGYFLYESVADRVEYDQFFLKLGLPDTFYSWFAITELHVWMLMVRAMAEGEDGRYARNSIVQAMWTDVDQRVKKLGAANPTGIRAQVDELAEQFHAALVAYDEGLIKDDVTLASALWRRFFQMQFDNPQHIEKLVIYVRRQIKKLDSLSSSQFLDPKNISWIPLEQK